MQQQAQQPQPQQAGDATLRALQFAVQTTLNAKKLQQENDALKQKLKENEQLLADFEDAAPRAKSLKSQLKAKEEKLEQKRKELIQVQEAIISTLKAQAQPSNEDPMDSLRPIPIVMNNIQTLIMGLTEKAVDNRTTAIPVLDLFGVSDKLNRLYDALVEQEIITETPEEKDARNQEYVANQQQILTKLKEMLASAEEEEELVEEEAAEAVEEEEEKKEEKPKVEVVEEKPAEEKPAEEQPAEQQQAEQQPEAAPAAAEAPKE